MKKRKWKYKKNINGEKRDVRDIYIWKNIARGILLEGGINVYSAYLMYGDGEIVFTLVK